MTNLKNNREESILKPCCGSGYHSWWNTPCEKCGELPGGDFIAYKEIILCAVRYALGRKTYIVSTVCRYVARLNKRLSEKERWLILKDIDECEDLGHEIDAKYWRDLKAVLELREPEGPLKSDLNLESDDNNESGFIYSREG